MPIGLVGALFLAGGGLSALGTFNQSLAEKRALEIQAATSARNVRLADIRIAQTKEAGQLDAATIRRNIRSANASLKTRLARGGIDLGFGTPVDILSDPQVIGEFDLATIKRNTANRVFELEIAKKNAIDQTNLLSTAASEVDPAFSAFNSLLGGVTSFAQNQQAQRNFNKGQTITIKRA